MSLQNQAETVGRLLDKSILDLPEIFGHHRGVFEGKFVRAGKLVVVGPSSAYGDDVYHADLNNGVLLHPPMREQVLAEVQAHEGDTNSPLLRSKYSDRVVQLHDAGMFDMILLAEMSAGMQNLYAERYPDRQGQDIIVMTYGQSEGFGRANPVGRFVTAKLFAEALGDSAFVPMPAVPQD